MLKKHGIKPCTVKILKEKKLDEMALSLKPIRRSIRAMVHNDLKADHEKLMSSKPLLVKNNAERAKKPMNVPKPTLVKNKVGRPMKSTPVKSILVNNHLRQRAKSVDQRAKTVSFDIAAQSSDGHKDTNIQPARRTNHRSFSIDSHVSNRSTNQSSQILDAIDSTMRDGSAISSVRNAHQLSSDEIRGYENRIDCLVESNAAKINRIQLLTTENKSLKSQLEVMDRINRSMANTIDAYEQNSPSIPMNSQIEKLNDDINVLRERIKRLNNGAIAMDIERRRLSQLNARLKNENEKLNDILKTHSVKVSQEHNYHM